MRWRERIRSERGLFAPYVTRSTRDADLEYPFDPDEYPALTKAADEWSGRRSSLVEKLRKKSRN